MQICFFWQKVIPAPIVREFHFGEYLPGERSVHFDTWDGGDAVRFTKNIYTFARILGPQRVGITSALLGQLLPLCKIKTRKIEFVKFFRTPWTPQRMDLFESYVDHVDRLVRSDPRNKWEILRKYPMDPGYAYDYYVERDACDFNPADDYWEIVSKFAIYMPIESIPKRTFKKPDDAFILKWAPFYSMDGRSRAADFEACRFSWEVAKKAQESVLLISPSLLNEFGLLRVSSGAYMCTQSVFEVFQPELDADFWDFRIMSSTSI